MKRVSIQLSARLANWLVAEAKHTGRSRTALVSEAVERLRGRSLNRPKRGKQFKNMAEALRSCGEPFHGPGDLTTNPKYWEDFGK